MKEVSTPEPLRWMKGELGSDVNEKIRWCMFYFNFLATMFILADGHSCRVRGRKSKMMRVSETRARRRAPANLAMPALVVGAKAEPAVVVSKTPAPVL